MTTWAHPTTLDEALAALAEPGARPAAGCTRLAFELADPSRRPARLVSLRGVPGLAEVTPVATAAGRCLEIGAMATHAQVAAHPAVRARFRLLAEVFTLVGNVRVRGVATVGGVLAGAVYAWDPPTALLALGARVRVSGPDGAVRVVPLAEFYPAPGQTVLRPGELITTVEVDEPAPGTVGRYVSFRTRSAEDTSALGVAVMVRIVDGVCASVRIAVGSGTPMPVRFRDIDTLLVGRSPEDTRIRAVADAYADAVLCVDDLRASAEYRTEMVRVWIRRTLSAAIADAHRPTGPQTREPTGGPTAPDSLAGGW